MFGGSKISESQQRKSKIINLKESKMMFPRIMKSKVPDFKIGKWSCQNPKKFNKLNIQNASPNEYLNLKECKMKFPRIMKRKIPNSINGHSKIHKNSKCQSQ